METLDAGFTPFGIGFQDDLAIPRGKKAVTALLQLRPQLRVVVDAAVEYQNLPGIGVQQRLVCPGIQIDDRQAAVSQCDRALVPLALVIGSPAG